MEQGNLIERTIILRTKKSTRSISKINGVKVSIEKMVRETLPNLTNVKISEKGEPTAMDTYFIPGRQFPVRKYEVLITTDSNYDQSQILRKFTSEGFIII